MYVSFALQELLKEQTENVVNTKLEAYLRDLFAICVSKYGKGSKSQPSSSDSSDSSACGISQNVFWELSCTWRNKRMILKV